ncbi:MAG: PQQ-binding-like beta-propeller repeat protein [Pseudomonadota bacterium]
MLKKGLLAFLILILAVVGTAVFVFASISSPKSFAPPDRTQWAPEGPRVLPYIGDETDLAGGDVLGNPLTHFRALHAGSLNSDEIAIATAPVFKDDWVAEPEMFITEGPTFDRSGNIYFSPTFSPKEDISLISLDSENGSRRWVINDPPRGSGAPLILDDPDAPGEEIIYVGGYNWAAALRPNADQNGDGVVDTTEMIWRVPTGLTEGQSERAHHMFGLNYDPTTDSLIGQTRDNYIYVLDRKSGAQRLASPYTLPDIAPSPTRTTGDISERMQGRLEEAAQPFFGDISFQDLVGVLLGNNTMVANYFSIDPHSGRIWVAATAPDGEDGRVDGVSEYGAIYALKLVPSEDELLEMEGLFHISFAGGSASTPALSADGKRLYFGDNFGKLITVDATNGNTLWELDLGEQIFGSISVASDNGELYIPAATSLIKVFDDGASGTKAWHANLDMYPEFGINRNARSLTGTITANGIAFMGSSELDFGPGLIVSVGSGLLDRETGQLRYFTEGREDSISVTAIGPDGAFYIAHSPIKRMFAAAALGDRVEPLVGGIQKYTPIRLDLLIRDALHAAADRASNVAMNGLDWSDELKSIEVRQITILIDQSRTASLKAIADGELTPSKWDTIEVYLNTAEDALDTMDFAAATAALQDADSVL